MSLQLLTIAGSIIFLLFIVIGLYVLLVIQRINTIKRKRKIEAIIEARQEDWYALLIDGNLKVDKLAPTNALEIEAADQVLYRYRQNFDSELIHRKTFEFTELYLELSYREKLKSKQWSVRMNTLLRIRLYKLEYMAEDVLNMLSSKRKHSKEEILNIYKIIGMMYPEKFMAYFINPIIQLGEFDYRRIIVTLQTTQLVLLIKQFDELPKVMQYVIVDVVGDKFYIELLPLLQKCLSSDDIELRIRALKAVAHLDTCLDSNVAESFAISDVWEERLMIAKIYANAPLEVAHDSLTKLLSDPVYQVRKQAAESLKIIRTGDEVLQIFIQQSDDKFAVEMATEIVGRS